MLRSFALMLDPMLKIPLGNLPRKLRGRPSNLCPSVSSRTPVFTDGRTASLSIIIYQHSIQLMIGREIYPAATFGFSITFSTVLHLGHIMVLPRYPSPAILSMTVCLSLGSPLYINVLPQSGTGQRAMGIRFIVFSIGTTSFLSYTNQTN